MRLSIAGKLIAVVSIGLVVVLTAGFMWVLRREDRQARDYFQRELAAITGYARAVQGFLTEHRSLPSPSDTLSCKLTEVPVVAAWRISQRFSSERGYTFTTPSLAPRRPGNMPDEFERRALEAFARNPVLEVHSETTEVGTQPVYRYAVPIRLTPDCLPCHGPSAGKPDRLGYLKEGMSAGDLKGAFVASVPLTSVKNRQKESRRFLFWIGFSIVALTSTVVFLAIRAVLGPLRELVMTIRRIGLGEIAQRVEVRSLDEVGDLAREFNEMANRLAASYAHMEERVQERTRALKRSQAQLVQASKLAALGELVGGIAHEVNNPTGIIVMRSASLMQQVEADGLSEDLREDVEVILRQSEKITQITSGLLAFSRQTPFSPQPTDINRTVSNAAGLIENMLKNRDIVYMPRLAKGLPLVEADTTRVEQVLLNLFNNAMDAMPAGGELGVETELETDEEGGQWVRIWVKDTGEGIREDHMDRLFDPFFTTKDVGKGTGLGLAISYGIVQEHGGRLEVESAWGEGAAFGIVLPLTHGNSEEDAI